MAQQPQMNMAHVGGPVQSAGTPNSGFGINHDIVLRRLNTAIYDYLLRGHHYDAAREICKVLTIESKETKQSPNQRAGQQANGADDGMEIDSKDQGLLGKPEDLPMPVNVGGDGPFLQDWWCQFWEVWNAHRKGAGPSGPMQAYLAQQRQSFSSRTSLMNNLNNNSNQMRPMNPMMQANGMMAGNELKRAAMQNNRQMYVLRPRHCYRLY